MATYNELCEEAQVLLASWRTAETQQQKDGIKARHEEVMAQIRALGEKASHDNSNCLCGGYNTEE